MSDNQISNIGELLKSKRESLDKSISTAAMQTNLSSSVIEKLENNQFNEIGAPVFVRGYLISYAKYLGLDVDAITRSFNQIDIKETEIKISNVNVASHTKSYKKNRFWSWFSLLIIVLILIVLISQVVNKDSWLMMQFNRAFTEENKPTNVVENGQEGLLIEIGGASENNTAPSNPIVLDSPQEIGTPETNQVGQSVYELNSDGVSSEESPITEVDNEKIEVDIDSSETNNNVDNNIEQNETEIAPVSDDSTPIVITPLSDNWMEIKDKNGRVLYSQLFKNNEHVNLSADGAPYVLTVGRPDNVALQINGANVELKNYKINNSSRNYRIGLD